MQLDFHGRKFSSIRRENEENCKFWTFQRKTKQGLLNRLSEFSLTENNWGITQIFCIDTAWNIIPLPLPGSCCIHMTTLFLKIVRFAACPCRITTRKWCVVNPVEFVVSLSIKTKPRPPKCDSVLLLDQVKYELILIGWSDYGEVCCQTLASSSGDTPLQGWSIDDSVTWISVKHPRVWTGWKDKRRIINMKCNR